LCYVVKKRGKRKKTHIEQKPASYRCDVEWGASERGPDKPLRWEAGGGRGKNVWARPRGLVYAKKKKQSPGGVKVTKTSQRKNTERRNTYL